MIRRAALLAALTTAAACLAGSPAAATPAPPACATGAITAFSAGLGWHAAPTVSVTGWMRRCASGPPANSFDIIFYGEETGHVSLDRIRPFAPDGVPTSFTTSATRSSLTAPSGAVHTIELPLAICVGMRAQTPVDCVRITPRATGLPPLVERIPVDGTTVFLKPVTIADDPMVPRTSPGCGNCV